MDLEDKLSSCVVGLECDFLTNVDFSFDVFEESDRIDFGEMTNVVSFCSFSFKPLSSLGSLNGRTISESV